MSNKIDIKKLEEKIQRTKRNLKRRGREKTNCCKDTKFTMDIVKDLTKEDLYCISNNTNLREKICKKIEKFTQEENEDYFQTVIYLAHNLVYFTSIDISKISDYFAFAFFWKNLNYQVENGGFLQYLHNEYYENEGHSVLALLNSFIFFKNASEIKEIIENAFEILEKIKEINDEIDSIYNYEEEEEEEDHIIELEAMQKELQQNLDKLDRKFWSINKEFNNQLESFYEKDLIRNRTLFSKKSF